MNYMDTNYYFDLMILEADAQEEVLDWLRYEADMATNPYNN